jgi:hypothetical protein
MSVKISGKNVDLIKFLGLLGSQVQIFSHLW